MDVKQAKIERGERVFVEMIAATRRQFVLWKGGRILEGGIFGVTGDTMPVTRKGI